MEESVEQHANKMFDLLHIELVQISIIILIELSMLHS